MMQLLLFSLLFVACGNEQPEQGNSTAPKETAPIAQKAQPEKKKTILFFGNSLTAAYGLDPARGFVALIQQRLDSLGLPWRTVNAGLSGETSAGGKERIDWVLRQEVDIFVLEPGANDALRGLPPETAKENLEALY